MSTKIQMRQGFALVFFIGLLLWRCSDAPTSPPTVPIDLTTAEKGLIESDNRFGVKLFQKIVASEPSKNVFISPLSVAMSLGMTYNGASGDTREAMGQVLELSGLSLEEINESYRHLIDLLTQLDPQVQFDIANSIWYRHPDFPEPETDFLQRCEDYFDALVAGLDFSDPAAASTINAWVLESTNGMIAHIVDDPINPLYVMFLINAIYFKGAWTHRFDEEWTHLEYFTLPDGTQIMCPMMAQRDLYTHYSGDDFRVLDLPYGGTAFRMTILLPDEGVDLDSLIAEINANDLNFELMDDLLSLTSRDSLDIFIPKFTLEYGIELKSILSALGMDIAFTPGADFTNMYATGGVWIDEVKHKTFVEVNEEGTQAASVAASMITSGIDETVFRVDRPFAFVIRENYSQTILFMGKIANPTSE